MNRKKGIISLCIIVLVMMVVGWFLSYKGLPAPPPELKDGVLHEIRKTAPYMESHIEWFDENGGKREVFTHRYFGKYGTCAVILVYNGHLGTDLSGNPLKPRFAIGGLSRRVEVPVECKVWLYNYDKDCKTNEGRYATRFETLRGVKDSELNWLTDEQLEQLTSDVEAWVAAGNY